ncbi:hypothetical protein CsSME_00023578 [Camellia sinensis var. sinensis]
MDVRIIQHLYNAFFAALLGLSLGTVSVLCSIYDTDIAAVTLVHLRASFSFYIMST